MIAAVFLGVLLTASHRLWRVLVVSIAAAMTHSLSFFAARILGRSQAWIFGNDFLPRFLLGGENACRLRAFIGRGMGWADVSPTA